MAGQPIAADRAARFLEKTASEAETLLELSQRVTEGETLVEVCAAWDVPHARVASWLESDAARWSVYERALRLRSDALVAETLAVARGAQPTIIEHTRKDGTVVEVPVFADHQRDKLIVDTQFRVAAKYDRARFGGEVEAAPRTVKPVSEVTMLEGARRIAFALARGAQVAERAKREPRLLEGKATVEPIQTGEPDDDYV